MNRLCLFVNSDLKIIGFAQLYPCFSSAKMQRLWTLNDLYVREECRGRGVARKLIQQCQRFCNNTGIYAINKELIEGFSIGDKLYSRVGFKEKEVDVYEWIPRVKNSIESELGEG